MTANDAITKIRVLLGVEEEVAVAMASATLVDGTQVEGELEIGTALFVVTPDGNVPAPAGMHSTTDNLMITVDESGIITSIEEFAPEATAPEAVVDVALAEEEVIVEETPEDEKEIEVMLAEDLVVKIVDELKPFLETISELQAKVTEMESKFQKFSKEPAAKPIKKAEAFTVNKMNAIDRIKSVRNNK